MALKEYKPEKLLFSMGEVTEMFDVKPSLIRFWEQRFDILKPQKNKKGNRLFTPADVKNLEIIYHLTKERGMTLNGVEKYLKNNKAEAERETEIVRRLQTIRALLLEIREELKEYPQGDRSASVTDDSMDTFGHDELSLKPQRQEARKESETPAEERTACAPLDNSGPLVAAEAFDSVEIQSSHPVADSPDLQPEVRKALSLQQDSLPNSAEPRLNPEVTADPDQRVLEGFAARENSFGSSAPTDTPYETLTADQEAPQEQDAWKGLAAKEDFVELSDPIDNRHEIFAGKQENSQEQDAWEAPADQEPPFQLNKYSDDPYDKLTADPENSPGYDGLEAFAAIEDAVELSDPAGNRQEIYAADREITDHSESYAPVHFIGSRVAEPESQYTAHEFLEIAEREMTTTEGPETLGFTGQMKGAFVQEDMDQEGVLDAELSVPFTAQALFPLEETEEADPGPFLSEAGKDQEKSTAVDTQQSLF